MNTGTHFGQPQSRRPGLTLIEIITVLAIMGIVAALTLVALGGVRESAKSTKSAGHMRQWGVALHLHLADNDGVIPFEGDADRMTWGRIANTANQQAWFNVLPQYVGMLPMRELDSAGRQAFTRTAGIHHCPLVEWRDHRQPNFSYMMNSQIYHPAGPGDDADSPVRYSHIQDPAMTVMFADLNQQFNTRPRGRGRHVDARHRNNQTNILFFDGSVARFDADYVQLDNYSVDGVDYTDNNKPDLIWNPWNHPRLQNF